MSARSVVFTLTAVSAVLAGCSLGGGSSTHAVHDGSSSTGAVGGAAARSSNSETPASTDPTAPAEAPDPCMSLIAEVAADRSRVGHGDDWRPAQVALTILARDFGPTVTYDFSWGPVTDDKSFAGRSVYAIVQDRNSPVDGDTVRKTIEGFHLGVPVIILRSCTTRSALAQLRRQIDARARSLPIKSLSTSVSAAHGAVHVTVYPRRIAKVLRDQYGDRVHVEVARISMS